MTTSANQGGEMLPDFWRLPDEPPVGTILVPALRDEHDELYSAVHAYRRVDDTHFGWGSITEAGFPAGGPTNSFTAVLERCGWHAVRVVDVGGMVLDMAAAAAFRALHISVDGHDHTPDGGWSALTLTGRESWRRVAHAAIDSYRANGPQAMPQPDFYPVDPAKAEEVERLRVRVVRALRLPADTPIEEVWAKSRETFRYLASLFSTPVDDEVVDDGEIACETPPGADTFPTPQVAAWMKRVNAREAVMVRGVAGNTGEEVLRGELVGWTAEPQLAIRVAPGATVRWSASLVEEVPSPDGGDTR